VFMGLNHEERHICATALCETWLVRYRNSILDELMPFAVLLSLLPLVLTYSAWRSHLKLDPLLAPARLVPFKFGLLLSILCSLATMCSWLHPFPQVPDGHGGYSDSRNFTLSTVALYAALVIIPLAIFGRDSARLSLIGSGFLLAIVAYAALLSGGH
jgi:hypothetical protein